MEVGQGLQGRSLRGCGGLASSPLGMSVALSAWGACLACVTTRDVIGLLALFNETDIPSRV